jgi:serine/threonine-protein kinase
VTLSPGDRLVGKYIINHLIGKGGMGSVYAANDEQLNRMVAIKLLNNSYSRDEEGIKLALREARAVAQLRSEHVARVLDAGVADDRQPYIVMEYLRGADLRQRMDETQLSIPEAVGFIVQACEAIAEAHSAGIIHQDLKPDNLFVTIGVDGLPHVKLLDFGIYRKTSEGPSFSSSSGQLFHYMGSPYYLAPERLRQSRLIDKRSDIWSLGVILYEALSGCQPFKGDGLPDLVAAILEKVPPSLCTLRPEIPQALDRIVKDCLIKDPNLRLPSAGYLAEALLPFAPSWALPAGNRTLCLDSRSDPERAEVVVEHVATLSTQRSSETMPKGAEVRHSPWRFFAIFSSPRKRWLFIGALGSVPIVMATILIFQNGAPRRNQDKQMARSLTEDPKPSALIPSALPEPPSLSERVLADKVPKEKSIPEPPAHPVNTQIRQKEAKAHHPPSRRTLPLDPLEGRK